MTKNNRKSNMERKLTAILSADVEGYSRLMGEDEEGTVKTLNTYREAMGRLIEEHQGRVIDSPGDNLLAEFSSAVNAVQCAVVIQGEFRARNAALAEDHRMHYRIGINLGDVLVEGERIYGDGVNVAARVESLAEGGGICISSTVYDQVVNKLTFAFDNLGEHTVKNITTPVRVYAVRWDLEKMSKQKVKPSMQRVWTAAVVLVVSALAINVWLQVYRESKSLPQNEIPSIAVLPFRDMSPENDQEYFCEGIAEELLNAFTKVEGLRVAARTSSFRFKGENLDIPSIGKELNVTTVLEGSVRKDGNKLRITAQLINVTDGFHLWSETYDRQLKNIFAIQDEIAQAMTKVLQVKLMGGSGASLVKTYTVNIEAYDQYLLGRYRWNQRRGKGKQSEVDLMAAIKHFKKAITLDPNYARAYSGLADAYLVLPAYIPDINMIDVKEKAEDATMKALALSPDLAEAHSSLGHLMEFYDFNYIGAEKEYQRAIELNPKYGSAHYRYSYLLPKLGRLEESIAEARKAFELEPFSPIYHVALGRMLTFARQNDEAIEVYQRAIELNSNNADAWLWLMVTFISIEEFEEAGKAISHWAEIAGLDKEIVMHFISLIEKHTQTGEPVSPPPELEKYFAQFDWTTYLYAYLGHKEKTIELLEKQNDSLAYLYYFSAYDFLRSEPRFNELIQQKERELGL